MLVQQRLSQEKLVQQSLESNVSEMTKTSGNTMGISQCHKREKNMTELCDVVTREPKEVKISRNRMREESLVMMLPRT